MDEEEVVSAVIDNLNSNSSTDSLSARQGKVLNGKITALQNEIDNVATDADIDAIFNAST